MNQREFERVSVDRPVEFRVPGSEIEGVGRLMDLSDTGALFLSEAPLEPGTDVALRVATVATPKAAPLRISATVVRCFAAEASNKFNIACSFD